MDFGEIYPQSTATTIEPSFLHEPASKFSQLEWELDGLHHDFAAHPLEFDASASPARHSPFPFLHQASWSECSTGSAPSLPPSLRDSSASSSCDWPSTTTSASSSSMPFAETPPSWSPAAWPESVSSSPMTSMDDHFVPPGFLSDAGSVLKRRPDSEKGKSKITAEEWEQRKHTIISLHVPGRTLSDVRSIMETVGFKATWVPAMT